MRGPRTLCERDHFPCCVSGSKVLTNPRTAVLPSRGDEWGRGQSRTVMFSHVKLGEPFLRGPGFVSGPLEQSQGS